MPEISAANLNKIERELTRISANQNTLNGQVNGVAVQQKQTQRDVGNLAAEFRAYRLADERDKRIQRAEVKIIDVRMRLDNEFGHYAELRRLATGVVQAVDTGTITEDTIQAVTEKVMTTTPGYWLAPALVGLAAWLRDDPEISERAIAEAMRRDDAKTALFLALLLRRYGRNAAAAQWLRRYVGRQDPAALAAEFAVVLDAVATGAFGMESRPLILEQTGVWYDRLSADPTTVGQQVERWQKLIGSLRVSLEAERYPVLQAVSPAWERLQDMAEGASVHGRARELFSALLAREVSPSADLRARVDRILTNLVSEFDREEAPLRSEFDRYQAIIAHDGDLEAAQRSAEAAQAAQAETGDYLALLTNAAFYPKKSGTSEGTQQYAVYMARGWIARADEQLAEANRARAVGPVPVAIEGWTGDLADGTSQQDLAASLSTKIYTDTAAAVAAVKPGGATYGGSIVGAVFALIAIITFAHAAVPAGLVLLLIAACSGAVAAAEYRKLPARRAELQEQGLDRAEKAVAVLDRATAEYTDLLADWKVSDAKAVDLADFLGGLSSHAYLTRPADQLREVL